MNKNQQIQNLIRETRSLTDSNWAVIVAHLDGVWSIQAAPADPRNKPLLQEYLTSPKHSTKLLKAVKANQICDMRIGKFDDLGADRLFAFPMSDKSAILVGIDSLSPRFRKAWKVAADAASIMLTDEGLASQLQDALQELENTQQELQARISAQQAAEGKLIQTTKLAAVGEMAAGVAHELNNPLTSVVGFSELVLESLPPDSPQRADMTLVLKEARRARDVVRRLLDFSRQSETLLVKADVNELIKDVLALMEHLFHINGVTISAEFDEKIPWVLIDRNQMKQVFLNLLHNALNAMPGGGVLTLTSSQAMRYGIPYACVGIKDNGVGISRENLPRIFEPFFTTRAGQGGTGLGLSVTYGIVSEHGGVIEVESKPGEGSIFTVFLPLGVG